MRQQTDHETFEFAAEGEWQEIFSEAELDELAAELLAVSSERELDQFLGDLLKKASSAVGAVVSSPVARQVGGMLKGVAKQYLPMAGAALGSVAGGALGTATGAIPGIGPAIAPFAAQLARSAGGSLGKAAGGWLAGKLELESLEAEEAEFEVAKQFVRVAGEAMKNAAAAPPRAPPAETARRAVTDAMQKIAPGVLAKPGSTGAGGGSGRWFRKGKVVVLVGA
jgi:hypothetical protein